MCKILIVVILITSCLTASAGVFYIATGGDDLKGNGSDSMPWKSLSKACSQVNKPGDTIFVKAGIYDETITAKLAVGVSLLGEGNTSIITSTSLTAEWSPIIDMRSASLENGDQTISYLKFDGSSLKAAQALWIAKRNNVKIHNCTFIDFNYIGILWVGDGGDAGGDPYNNIIYPTNYVTGSKFFNNVITNCSLFNGYGRGGLYIGGHEGMLIYKNTITQTQRPNGYNGYPIKVFANGGFMKGMKIYDNVITKIDASTWEFAIEGAFYEGCEIYNNTIIGAIDINFMDKGDYDYGVYIHDNTLGPDTTSSSYFTGIILEFGVEDVIIERNHFRNCAVGIHHTMRHPEPWVKRVKVRYNKFSNLGSGSYHSAIRFGETEYSYEIQDYEIYNNVFHGNPVSSPYFGLHIRGFRNATNIKIQNNIFLNFSWSWFESNRGDFFDTLLVRNNILYNNANSNSATLNGTPSNYVKTGNIIANPNLNSESNFHPKSNSPVIDAGLFIPGIIYDLEGIKIENPPNIGCYEMTANSPDFETNQSSKIFGFGFLLLLIFGILTWIKHKNINR